jgi:hypothetical protein
MRFLIFTVMMGAFALLPVAGQQSEREESCVSWEGFLSEAAGLDARLGLGVVSAVEAKDAVLALVERGDQLLETCSGTTAGGDALATAREAVLSATADAVEAVILAKARLAAGATAPGVVVDPWAGIDQECGYFPEKLGQVMAPNGGSLPDVEQGELPRLVPPCYRLAEALGIGRNRAACEPRFIDPIQVQRPGNGIAGGVNIVARFYCEFTGHFVRNVAGGEGIDPLEPPDQQAGDGEKEVIVTAVDSAAEPGEATFRVVVISRGRSGAGFNRMSAEFEHRKVYGVENYDPTPVFLHGGPGNPWVREALPAAAAQRGWLVTPVRGDADTKASWVRDAVCEKLLALKGEIVRELRTDVDVRDRLEGLVECLDNHQSAVQDSMAKHLEKGEPTVAANFDLQAIDLAALVESGLLDDSVLGRIIPSTALALDATRRAVQVAHTPQAQQAKAAVMAETLNSLARWTLR